MKKEKNQYFIPMEMNDKSDIDFAYSQGFKPEDIIWWKIGNIKKRVILIPCTKEQYQEYMRPIWKKQYM